MSVRIVYIGAERVGLACLQRLIAQEKDIVAVFTADDRLQPRIADFVSFDGHLAAPNIPLVKITDSKDPNFMARVQAARPDLIVVISWSQILPPEIINAPLLGCVAIHYSMLPARRGGAPLNWALIDGLHETGITLYYMDAGIDTGDIILQKPLSIEREDTVKTLLDKVVVLAPETLSEGIDLIEKGQAPRIKQDETQASYTPRRRPADSLIDWSMSDEQIYNFIRALAPPYPCAFTYLDNRKLVIPHARFEQGKLWIEGFFE